MQNKTTIIARYARIPAPGESKTRTGLEQNGRHNEVTKTITGCIISRAANLLKTHIETPLVNSKAYMTPRTQHIDGTIT